jgi:hypothetical protein
MDEDERSFPGPPEFESVVIEKLEAPAAGSAGSMRRFWAQFPGAVFGERDIACHYFEL